MPGYGQFCPVAKAMEVLDERWTLLGSRHFNELRRGVPRMSPTLLTKRLRSLERAKIVRRRTDAHRTVYELTPCGAELFDVVQGLGLWGLKWIPELGDEDRSGDVSLEGPSECRRRIPDLFGHSALAQAAGRPAHGLAS